MVCLVTIDPKKFGGHNNLVSAVQRQGIRENDESTPTATVSERK